MDNEDDAVDLGAPPPFDPNATHEINPGIHEAYTHLDELHNFLNDKLSPIQKQQYEILSNVMAKYADEVSRSSDGTLAIDKKGKITSLPPRDYDEYQRTRDLYELLHKCVKERETTDQEREQYVKAHKEQLMGEFERRYFDRTGATTSNEQEKER